MRKTIRLRYYEAKQTRFDTVLALTMQYARNEDRKVIETSRAVHELIKEYMRKGNFMGSEDKTNAFIASQVAHAVRVLT